MANISSYIGMRVWVLPVGVDGNEGLGTISAYEQVTIKKRYRFPTPVITMDDGKVMRGYECWWTPYEAGGDHGREK